MSNGAISEQAAGIAIIGMAGRFPGANNVDEFWQNIRDEKESITFFSDEELSSSGISPALIGNPDYVKAKGILDDIDLFDAKLFGYSPKEAEIIDPQHRIFLECAWEVLDSTGYNSDAYEGRIGVYAGVGQNTYLLNLYSNPELMKTVNGMQLMLGNDKDFLSTRVAYKLNLKGPSITVQTGCSTSLVAVHLACQSLLCGECDVSLAGGVSIRIPQKAGYLYQQGGIFSPDGHCRAFDSRAQGTVSGNGVGVVVLKRLADAVADGDFVHAVIKGSAINNDGSLKVGFTAPSVDGQAEVIAEALAVADVEPETVTYIETHGTGTALGDLIEVAALTQVFRARTDQKNSCALSSAKSAIGHLDTAAGIAGLIKAVLALEHKMIPPSLHYAEPNPSIDFENSPFYVNSRASEWKKGQTARRAGVSSFGIGGTNAHVIIEEAPDPGPSAQSEAWQLLMLSARTRSALDAAASNLTAYLKQHTDINLSDVAYTLQVGRRSLPHRGMLVCRTAGDAVAGIETSFIRASASADQDAADRRLVFMFPGAGTQYVNMGLNLFESEPVFREQIDICSELLVTSVGYDLRRIIYPEAGQLETASEQLNDVTVAMPAVFVIEYALSKLWISWGVRPQAVIGHSLGEYVAACLAGVFSLQDALSLVVKRSRLLKGLPAGAMLGISLPEEQVRPLMIGALSLAAVNGPSQCVCSGLEEDIDTLQETLSERGVECKRLRVDVAAHSEMVARIMDEFAAYVARFTLRAPTIPYVSNVTGSWITAEEATDPNYWVRHLRDTVRFDDGIRTLLEEPNQLLLEVGPGKTLSSLAMLQPNKANAQVMLASMRHPYDRQSDVALILNTLGRLWLAGTQVDWTQFNAHRRRRRIPLPAYPFQRERYWIESHSRDGRDNPRALQRKPDIADWFSIPSWKRSLLLLSPEAESRGGRKLSCLVFLNECGMGHHVVRRLREAGHSVITVMQGARFARVNDREYAIHPRRREDYEELLDELRSKNGIPENIVHLWNLTAISNAPLGIEAFEIAQDGAFYSLSYLARALGMQSLTKPIQIVIVSNNMQRVAGEEALCPEKATLLGPCNTIPRVYSGISCRSLDIIIPESKESQKRLADCLIEELVAESTDRIISYRGPDRWVQTFEAVRLRRAANTKLRTNGVYLITGGSEGVGFELAKHLARSARAKVALVDHSAVLEQASGKNPSQNREDYENDGRASYEARIAMDMLEESAFITQLEEKIERELGLKGIAHHDGFKQRAYQLCSSYAFNYLSSGFANSGAGRRCDRKELARTLGVLPAFEKFYDVLIRVLSEDGIISAENGTIEFLKGREEVANPRILKREIEEQYPEFRGLLQLLEHCARNYEKALTGKIAAISVLYPSGSSDFLKDTSENTVEYRNARTYLRVLREVVLKVVKKSPRKRVRILEVGAGTGAFTRVIAPDLKDRNVEYHFTDLGKSFVINGEKAAAKNGFDFMKFGVLDISNDPVKQGYHPHSFDIIVGFNVVHATKDIRETATNLKGLLAPNGVLFLVELVRSYRWDDLIWGLAEGWWYFEDKNLRTESPLLSLGKWEEVLEQTGFKSVRAYPRNEKRKESEYGLIVAQQETAAEINSAREDPKVNGAELRAAQQRAERMAELKAEGAEVMSFSADISNLEQMRRVTSQIQECFGRISGVIHTARAVLQDTMETEMRRVERDVKITGALVLDSIFKHAELDFFVLSSSLASITGSPGDECYCAADAFLNAFAHYISLEDRHMVSIDWDRWRVDGSLGVGDGDPAGGTNAVTVAEGLEAFSRILSRDNLSQVVVSTRDLEAPINSNEVLTIEGSAKPPKEREEIDQCNLRHPRPALENHYVDPCTDNERALAAIWQDILGIDRVGIHDDFLELGGDSLIALQLMSRVRETFQVDLPVRSLISASTVAGLAGNIERGRQREISAAADQEPNLDRVPFTPAQLRFLENTPLETDQWVVNLVIDLRQHLDSALLERVAEHVVAHHHALRLRFRREESGWAQFYARGWETPFFSSVDLSELSEIEQAPAMEAVIAKTNAGLNPSEGVVRIIYFEFGTLRPGRIVIFIHHAIIDGVSIQILQKDLETAYQQLSLGQSVQLSPTTPFHLASQRLAEYAQSQELRPELDYWLAGAGEPVLRVPVDYLDGANTWDSIASVDISISSNETREILARLRKSSAQMNEVLLTALIQTISEWSKGRQVLIDLAEHGRRDFLGDIDTSGTIGFFLSVFPVLFDVGSTDDSVSGLKAVQKRLRQVPNGGVGYGLLRYACQDASVRDRLRRLPQSEVSFNYLGQLDQAFFESPLFKSANEAYRSPWSTRRYLFDVLARISSNRLQLNWLYSRNVHRQSTIEDLTHSLVAAFRALVEQL